MRVEPPQLRADHPDLAILLLSQAIETHFAAHLFERHGERFDYLLKDEVVDVSMLMHALHTITGGGTVLDPEIARRMMHVHAKSHPGAGAVRPRARCAGADGGGSLQCGPHRRVLAVLAALSVDGA